VRCDAPHHIPCFKAAAPVACLWAPRWRREQRRKELERHEAERAARAEQAQWVEQAAAREREVLEHEEAYLQMAEATLKLMKE
jgi:hypothetical protein